MKILLTGAAGFIGYHAARALLARGNRVIGIDNLNDYYEVGLKQSRLDLLHPLEGFSFHKYDISDRAPLLALAESDPDIGAVVHLAAQAGVRHSLTDPYTYVRSNVMGQVVMLELARRLPALRHFVYASSSSVYGGNTKLPFSVDDPVEKPNSLYAATKRADELISYAYAHLYDFPMTGLRFFTVYGPWGRPDMAAFLFVRAIIEGKPIRVFNHGEMWRDFTYIDDIVRGVLAVIDRPATGAPPHTVYNLGNNKSEKLTDFIAAIENALGMKAKLDLQPLQSGDVVSTHADIERSRRDLGFAPETRIEVGIQHFVDWYRGYYKV